jgi:hypothetical protein
LLQVARAESLTQLIGGVPSDPIAGAWTQVIRVVKIFIPWALRLHPLFFFTATSNCIFIHFLPSFQGNIIDCSIYSGGIGVTIVVLLVVVRVCIVVIVVV